MITLALDTSGPACGVAITRDGRVLYESAVINRLTHSASLMPMVDEALTRCDLPFSAVDQFACVVGLGSFTGVRIGVSTVKGMAHGAGKPCVAVNALEALAAGVGDRQALICPIQDARAGQVYGAAFKAGMPPVRKMADEAAKLELYLAHVLAAVGGDDPLCFVGDGVAVYRETLVAVLGSRAIFPPAHLATLRPASVALLAEAYMTERVDYLTLMPRYLRAPQAERARAAKLKAAQP